MVVLGLGVSNGLIALSGALIAQYQGFANIPMGVGAIVTGLANLMVGETLLGRRTHRPLDRGRGRARWCSACWWPPPSARGSTRTPSSW